MSRLTLRAIEIFIAAVEGGSVAAAAKRLDTSPSSISQHLSNLETTLGTTLMDRSTRPVSLTPAGFLFHKRALRILDEAKQARAELSVFDYAKLAKFSIAIIDDFDANVTPELMSQLSTEMPACHIVLQTGASYSNLVALESRQVDICIAAETEPPADWMEVYPLLSEPFVLLAQKGSLDPDRDTLPQLLQRPFIRFPDDQIVGQMIEAKLAESRLSIPHKFAFDSYHSIMAMVAKGAGWAIAPVMCYLHAQRFQDRVDMLPLPFPVSRRISLYARANTLDRMPRELAVRMGPLMQDMLVTPATTGHPWLEDRFTTLL